MAKLVEAMERNHGVTAAQIDHARAQRNPTFDAADALVRRLLCARRVGSGRPDSTSVLRHLPRVGGVAIAGASLGFSALGVQLGVMWTAIWECVRIGNGHLGAFRAAHDPWGQHLGELFVAGIVLFWIVALVLPSCRDAELAVEELADRFAMICRNRKL